MPFLISGIAAMTAGMNCSIGATGGSPGAASASSRVSRARASSNAAKGSTVGCAVSTSASARIWSAADSFGARSARANWSSNSSATSAPEPGAATAVRPRATCWAGPRSCLGNRLMPLCRTLRSSAGIILRTIAMIRPTGSSLLASWMPFFATALAPLTTFFARRFAKPKISSSPAALKPPPFTANWSTTASISSSVSDSTGRSAKWCSRCSR